MNKGVVMDRVYKNYVLMKKLYLKRIPVLPNLIRKYIRTVYGCDIFYTSEIGMGTRFPHNGTGVVIHSDAKIGENTIIYQNVTIGGLKGQGPPTIGNNVLIGAGACLLGEIKIGDNVQIGANAVVVKDIPSNATAIGVPARIIER